MTDAERARRRAHMVRHCKIDGYCVDPITTETVFVIRDERPPVRRA